MTLTQYLGDSITHSIPLKWQGATFTPGTDWLMIWTAKTLPTDPDEDAVVQKASGYGITASGSTASVALVPQDTAEEDPATLTWDIQAQHVSTGEVRTVAAGTLRLVRDLTRELETSITIYTTEPPAPMGPEGPEGPAGDPASVTAANVLTAIQAMNSTQKTDLLTALGFATYAGLAAGNAALNIGDVFRDSNDSNKFKTATA
jgi:hypothetical protein